MPAEITPVDSIDVLIARLLPAWLVKAQGEHVRALHVAMREQQAIAERVRAYFKRLPNLDDFAQALLEPALREAGLQKADVRETYVLIRQELALPTAAPNLPAPRRVFRSRQTLLAAALHNFHEEELQSSIFRRAHLENAHGTRLSLTFEAFVRCCRRLDIGGRYQELIHQLLNPKSRPGTPPGHAARQSELLLEGNLRLQMEVAVRLARLKGALTEQNYYRLLPLLSSRPVVPSVDGVLTARQLFLLGKRINGLVTLEVRHSKTAPVSMVIMWSPQDPESPIVEYPSWEALYQALAWRLNSPAYRRFFSRFISERDRPGFDRALARLRADRANTPVNLDGRNFAIEVSLFVHLRTLLQNKLRDDARVLAVPTGDEDQVSRHLRLQTMLSTGLDLLNLAALFVPVIGEFMLVVTAVQVADEVYEGYQDWQLGDRQGALEHLMGVAETVAVGAIIGGATHVAVGSLKRIPFVDELAPRCTRAGQLQLAHEALPVHYTEGAGPLVRQAGGEMAEASDLHAESLLQVTGLQPAQLRRLHLEQSRLPARLRDAHQRIALHEDFPALSGSAFETQLQGLQRPISDAEALLIRDFPSLSVRQAAEILDQVSSAQIEAMLSQQRIPLALAERARWAVRDARIDRACIGLQLPQAVNHDTERLALGLIAERVPWPSSVRVELREGSLAGPVLAAQGAATASDLRVLVKDAGGYHAVFEAGSPLSLPSDNCFQALLLTLDEGQRRTVRDAGLTSEQLRDWLAVHAGEDRDRCARLLEMAPVGQGVRPPLRFADGRIGYPLSGRASSSRQALRRGIHQVFPTLSEAELQAYLLELMNQRTDLWTHYRELQAALSRLKAALTQWRGEGSVLDAFKRRRVASQLRRCWRRKLVGPDNEYELVIDGEHVGALPTLPEGVDYSHVRRLVLRDMALNVVEADFLQRFPNVTELDLSENRLTQIPQGLASLPRLRRLDLSGNRIVMNSEGNRRLASSRLLQVLNLSHNPLGRAPELVGFHRLNHLNLRYTLLEALPASGRQLPRQAYVDLRNNSLRHIRQNLHSLRHRLRLMDLHDNPLDEESESELDIESGMEQGARGSASFRHRLLDDEVRDNWVGGAADNERAHRLALWNTLRNTQGSEDLFRFLADFSNTDDFRNHPQHYRSRVWRLLEGCEQHEALRTRLFLEAGGERTCADRLLLIMGQLEIAMLVERGMLEAPAGQVERQLLRLGRALFRLDALDVIAARHIEQMHSLGAALVDEIEVRLFYRVRLAKTLELPAQPRSMHFESYANVTSSDLIRARNEVLDAENGDALIESLAQRPFWEQHARRHYAERFETLSAPFYERLEALDDAAPTSGAYLQASNALMTELNDAQQGLLRTLAREAYDRSVPE